MIKKLVISIPRWVIFSHRSARGPPSPRGGRGAQLHRHQGDVALPVARETARADPRIPGALRPCREWRISRPAPHQGHHASRCTGMLARRCRCDDY